MVSLESQLMNDGLYKKRAIYELKLRSEWIFELAPASC